MKRRSGLLVIAPMLIAAAALGQGSLAHQAPSPDLSQLTGVWRGQMEGLPAVDLVISDESGTLRARSFSTFICGRQSTIRGPPRRACPSRCST